MLIMLVSHWMRDSSWNHFVSCRVTAKLACPMLLHKYPLDTQGCPMIFSSCTCISFNLFVCLWTANVQYIRHHRSISMGYLRHAHPLDVTSSSGFLRILTAMCCGFKSATSTSTLRSCNRCVWDWLRVPERVVYKIAVLTFKVLHGIAPECLGPVVRVVDLPGRQSLRSAGTTLLVVPPFKLSTIGTRAFPVASHSLPADITSAPSLSTFCQRLQT